MNSLAKEITQYLSEQTYPFDIKFTRVFDPSDIKFPRVIVSQISDTTAIRTANDEYVAFVGFQLEIYTKDCIRLDGSITNKIDASDEISEAIDKFMYTKYRMNRVDVQSDYYYKTDVTRKILRYDGFIDRYGYMYRTR